MKRKLLFSAFIALIIAVSASIYAIAASGITLIVNGKTVHTETISRNNTTYVPLRAVSELLGADVGWDQKTKTITITGEGYTATKTDTTGYDATLTFPVDRYPQTAAHIKSAIKAGESAICTIDRDGADENRDESLAGIPTKDGYDRDEWPMAMCAEGGAGADVEYVPSSDNRGSGSWVGNALEDYPDGTRVLFVLDGEVTDAPTATPIPTESFDPNVIYANCTAVRNAGAAPIHRGDPGYSTKLDRDGDGIACE